MTVNSFKQSSLYMQYDILKFSALNKSVLYFDMIQIFCFNFSHLIILYSLIAINNNTDILFTKLFFKYLIFTSTTTSTC